MGLDLHPDVLTAGLAGHCQLDKEYPKSQKEMSASRETISHPQLRSCQSKVYKFRGG